MDKERIKGLLDEYHDAIAHEINQLDCGTDVSTWEGLQRKRRKIRRELEEELGLPENSYTGYWSFL